MKLEIYKNGGISTSDPRNIKYGEIEIDNKFTSLWYEEIMNNFKLLRKEENPSKQWYEKHPVYDIDESYECGQISLQHLIDLFLFLKENGNNI